MQLLLVNPALADEGDDDAATSVTLRVPSTPDMCSFCGNRPPAWFVDPAVVTDTEDLSKTALGAADSCAPCLNELLELGRVRVARVDPDSF